MIGKPAGLLGTISGYWAREVKGMFSLASRPAARGADQHQRFAGNFGLEVPVVGLEAAKDRDVDRAAE